jgi:hypothetical protein
VHIPSASSQPITYCYLFLSPPCSLAVRVHRDALLSMRGFWEVLMHSNVQFRTLARCIKHMDQSIKAADRVYK